MPRPRHPGLILREEFLDPADAKPADLSSLTGLDITRLDSVIAGSARIEADMAILFGRCLGTQPSFWLNLQSAYDLDCAARQLGSQVESVMPL
jgi:addiction module HigA family antidote